MKLTIDVLEKDAPELLVQIRDAAKNEGLSAGALAERERIKSVRAQLMPGHEALIETLMFDGKTTGPEAAVAVLAAERTARETLAANIQADGEKPLPGVTPREIESLTAKPKTPNQAWDADEALQKEFGGNKEAYLAYLEATGKGLVKTVGKNNQ